MPITYVAVLRECANKHNAIYGFKITEQRREFTWEWTRTETSASYLFEFIYITALVAFDI